MSDDNQAYEVGYAKPPEDTRFRKGASGNPQGRPKGSKNLATLFDKELKERVAINEGGRRKTVTKREAMVKQLVNKAVSCDKRLMEVLLDQIRVNEGRAESSAAGAIVDEADRKVMQQFQERMRHLIRSEGEENGSK
jgi:hypothetical protein